MGLPGWLADPIGLIWFVGVISFFYFAAKWWNEKEAKASANQAKLPRLSDQHKARQVRLSADHRARHKLPRVPGNGAFRLVVMVGILAAALRVVIALGIVVSPRLIAWDDGVLVVALALSVAGLIGYLMFYPPSAKYHPPLTTALPLTLVGALRLLAMRSPGLHSTADEMAAVRALIRRQVEDAMRLAAEAKYVRENNAQVLTTGELLLEVLRYHITSTTMPLGIWIEGGWDDRPEGGVTAQFRLRADGGLVISDVLADAWHKVAGSANLPMTLRQDRSRVTIDADSTAVFVVLGGPTPPPPPEKKPDAEDEPGEAPLDLETPLGIDRPPLSVLKEPNRHADGRPNEGKGAAKLILSALSQAGVNGCEVVDILPGPVLSTIIVKTPTDIPAPKILGMQDDLSYRTGLSIRLSKAIGHPGCIALEVPNNARASVSLAEVVGSPAFRSEKGHAGDLIATVGVDTQGKPAITNVARWPHALVGGTNGGGKSTMMNSVLVSLLMRYGPDQLRLILVDPKQVEFFGYEGLPHLMCPPLLFPPETIPMFEWVEQEMERRYTLMREHGVRELDKLNAQLPAGKHLPRIVIVIDEARDIMEDEDSRKAVIASAKSLASMARASGVHLIFATQKPTVNVVDSTVKANLTTRIALRVVTHTESTVILDQDGAQDLLGKGDLLLMDAEGKITRAQSPFAQDDEIRKVVEWWADWGRKHPESYRYDPDLIEAITPVVLDRKGGVPDLSVHRVHEQGREDQANREQAEEVQPEQTIDLAEDRLEQDAREANAPDDGGHEDGHARDRSDDREDDRGPGDDGPDLGGDNNGNWYGGDGHGGPKVPSPKPAPSAPAKDQDHPRKPGLRVVSINGKVVLDERGRNPHRTQRDGGRDR